MTWSVTALTPNSRTYTMQEASGRERFSGKKPEQLSTKNTKQLPSKGAQYSPHALAPHKSMCNKVAYNSHRHSRNPRKDFSHPFIPFSHTFIIAYQSPRLSIDSLNLVCARTRHIPTTCQRLQAMFTKQVRIIRMEHISPSKSSQLYVNSLARSTLYQPTSRKSLQPLPWHAVCINMIIQIVSG